MFSFGPIKTATALAGGVLTVHDSSLLERMRTLHANYPVQSRWSFLKRVLFYCVLHWLGGRFVFTAFYRICRWLGQDLDRLLNGSIRNFPQAEFFEKLRQQPSTPLLRLLARRIQTYRDAELDRRAARGRLLLSLLPEESCPGGEADVHSFWVFPVKVSDSSAAIRALHLAGFDATTVNSLRTVEPPANRPDLEPRAARTALESVIYVPVYAAIPDAEIRRLAEVLRPFIATVKFVDRDMACRVTGMASA
jgi:dTDP-4-amino-4,6-dideoxygalactose transaminase